MYSIRLRGIYATALAALVRDHGWKVVQPTEELQPYSDPADRFAPFDLDIQDHDDRQGILAVGAEAPLNAFKELLFEKLPDAIACPAPTELGAIYLGVVHKKRSWGYDVDLGGMMGFLPQADLMCSLRRGEAIRVQVQDIAHHQPIVTTQLSLAGRFAVLSHENGVGVSKEITDPDERARLLALGRKCTANGWGVIWRTGAYGQDASELQREIKLLQRELAGLEGHPEEGIPGRLRAGQTTLLVEFPSGSKGALDRWRAYLLPTEPGYHRQHIERTHQKGTVRCVGDAAVIEHVKAQNELSMIMSGRIVEAMLQRILIRREIRGQGVYDGLGMSKKPGDYAISEFCEGAWQYETRYYTCEGHLKGMYVNINTPIEIYANRVRYVDLELDVVQRPGEPAEIIDEPDLQKIAHLLSPHLIARVYAIAAESVKALNERSSGA
jgi:Ribonuclease G/E